MRRGLLVALPAVLACAGCARPADAVVGSGAVTAEQRRVGGFRALEVRGQGLVLVSRAAAGGLGITADDNVVPLIRSEVRDGVLRVTLDRQVEPKVPITIRVTAPALDRIAVAGAVALEASGIDGDVFAVDASGAAKGTLVGQARQLRATASGAVRLDLARLRAVTAAVQVSGTGDVTVSASERLDVQISGAARVGYYGSPAVQQRISGAGQVAPLGPVATP
jgi:hypothetical protein